MASSTLGSMGVVACMSRYSGVPLSRMPFFSMMAAGGVGRGKAVNYFSALAESAVWLGVGGSCTYMGQHPRSPLLQSQAGMPTSMRVKASRRTSTSAPWWIRATGRWPAIGLRC